MNKKNIDKANMTALLNFIKEQEKIIDGKKKWRKVTEMDILGKVTNKKVIKEAKKNGSKVASFRMQEEFGPKKRIKP